MSSATRNPARSDETVLEGFGYAQELDRSLHFWTPGAGLRRDQRGTRLGVEHPARSDRADDPRLRLRRRWHTQPGSPYAGRFGRAMTIVAFLWATIEGVNIGWPRSSGGAWYQTWAAVFGLGAFAVVGGLYFAWARPHRRLTEDAAALSPAAAEPPSPHSPTLGVGGAPEVRAAATIGDAE